MTAAVVVGGVSGIGAAVARMQGARGADVLVWDLSREADVRCDISDPKQVDDAAAATLERIGPPDQVTLTAGVGHVGTLLESSADDWERVLGTNAKGAWLAMRALAAPMCARGGSIVATSSVSARLADPNMGLYCASKAALDMLIRVAAIEWAPKVRVNGVAPGVTDTPMLPGPRDGPWLRGVAGRTALRRLGTPEDVAATILALHEMPWVTGQILPCDGGLSLRSPIMEMEPRADDGGERHG